MEKQRDWTGLILAAALSAGAFYYLFYTERGQKWILKLQNAAADKLDELLELLEKELAEAEGKALHLDEPTEE
jgi:hypothetical protein